MYIETESKNLTIPGDEPLIWVLCALFALFGLIYGCLWIFAPSVRVEWTTVSELDTVGYNLLRSENKENGYKQVNDAIIPVTTDALGGGKYFYIDKKVRACVQYYYLLEDINADGTRGRNGPIQVEQVGLAELVMAVCFFLAGVTGLWILSIRRRLMKRDRTRGVAFARQGG